MKIEVFFCVLSVVSVKEKEKERESVYMIREITNKDHKLLDRKCQYEKKVSNPRFLQDALPSTERKRQCLCSQDHTTRPTNIFQTKTDRVNDKRVARVAQLAIACRELAPLVVGAPPVVFDTDDDEPVVMLLEPDELEPVFELPPEEV